MLFKFAAVFTVIVVFCESRNIFPPSTQPNSTLVIWYPITVDAADINATDNSPLQKFLIWKLASQYNITGILKNNGSNSHKKWNHKHSGEEKEKPRMKIVLHREPIIDKDIKKVNVLQWIREQPSSELHPNTSNSTKHTFRVYNQNSSHLGDAGNTEDSNSTGGTDLQNKFAIFQIIKNPHVNLGVNIGEGNTNSNLGINSATNFDRTNHQSNTQNPNIDMKNKFEPVENIDEIRFPPDVGFSDPGIMNEIKKKITADKGNYNEGTNVGNNNENSRFVIDNENKPAIKTDITNQNHNEGTNTGINNENSGFAISNKFRPAITTDKTNMNHNEGTNVGNDNENSRFVIDNNKYKPAIKTDTTSQNHNEGTNAGCNNENSGFAISNKFRPAISGDTTNQNHNEGTNTGSNNENSGFASSNKFRPAITTDTTNMNHNEGTNVGNDNENSRFVIDNKYKPAIKTDTTSQNHNEGTNVGCNNENSGFAISNKFRPAISGDTTNQNHNEETNTGNNNENSGFAISNKLRPAIKSDTTNHNHNEGTNTGNNNENSAFAISNKLRPAIKTDSSNQNHNEGITTGNNNENSGFAISNKLRPAIKSDTTNHNHNEGTNTGSNNVNSGFVINNKLNLLIKTDTTSQNHNEGTNVGGNNKNSGFAISNKFRPVILADTKNQNHNEGKNTGNNNKNSGLAISNKLRPAIKSDTTNHNHNEGTNTGNNNANSGFVINNKLNPPIKTDTTSQNHNEGTNVGDNNKNSGFAISNKFRPVILADTTNQNHNEGINTGNNNENSGFAISNKFRPVILADTTNQNHNEGTNTRNKNENSGFAISNKFRPTIKTDKTNQNHNEGTNEGDNNENSRFVIDNKFKPAITPDTTNNNHNKETNIGNNNKDSKNGTEHILDEHNQNLNHLEESNSTDLENKFGLFQIIRKPQINVALNIGKGNTNSNLGINSALEQTTNTDGTNHQPNLENPNLGINNFEPLGNTDYIIYHPNVEYPDLGIKNEFGHETTADKVNLNEGINTGNNNKNTEFVIDNKLSPAITTGTTSQNHNEGTNVGDHNKNSGFVIGNNFRPAIKADTTNQNHNEGTNVGNNNESSGFVISNKFIPAIDADATNHNHNEGTNVGNNNENSRFVISNKFRPAITTDTTIQNHNEGTNVGDHNKNSGFVILNQVRPEIGTDTTNNYQHNEGTTVGNNNVNSGPGIVVHISKTKKKDLSEKLNNIADGHGNAENIITGTTIPWVYNKKIIISDNQINNAGKNIGDRPVNIPTDDVINDNHNEGTNTGNRNTNKNFVIGNKDHESYATPNQGSGDEIGNSRINLDDKFWNSPNDNQNVGKNTGNLNKNTGFVIANKFQNPSVPDRDGQLNKIRNPIINPELKNPNQTSNTDEKTENIIKNILSALLHVAETSNKREHGIQNSDGAGNSEVDITKTYGEPLVDIEISDKKATNRMNLGDVVENSGVDHNKNHNIGKNSGSGNKNQFIINNKYNHITDKQVDIVPIQMKTSELGSPNFDYYGNDPANLLNKYQELQNDELPSNMDFYDYQITDPDLANRNSKSDPEKSNPSSDQDFQNRYSSYTGDPANNFESTKIVTPDLNYDLKNKKPHNPHEPELTPQPTRTSTSNLYISVPGKKHIQHTDPTNGHDSYVIGVIKPTQHSFLPNVAVTKNQQHTKEPSPSTKQEILRSTTSENFVTSTEFYKTLSTELITELPVAEEVHLPENSDQSSVLKLVLQVIKLLSEERYLNSHKYQSRLLNYIKLIKHYRKLIKLSPHTSISDLSDQTKSNESDLPESSDAKPCNENHALEMVISLIKELQAKTEGLQPGDLPSISNFDILLQLENIIENQLRSYEKAYRLKEIKVLLDNYSKSHNQNDSKNCNCLLKLGQTLLSEVNKTKALRKR